MQNALNLHFVYIKCQMYRLPVCRFQWLSECELDNYNNANVLIDSTICYFMECDLRYQEHLHDAHNAVVYPLMLEHLCIDADMLSDMLHFMMGKTGAVHLLGMKLILNLHDKMRYMTH